VITHSKYLVIPPLTSFIVATVLRVQYVERFSGFVFNTEEVVKVGLVDDCCTSV